MNLEMKIISKIIFFIKNFYYNSCELFLDKFKMKCKNFGKDNQLLLFDILDYIVEQGNMNTWISVSSKKFLSFLIDILKDQTDAEIHTKILQLIQNWGIDFDKKRDAVPNFSKVYNKFKSNGVVFPPREESNYYKYIANNNPSKQNYNYKNEDDYEDNKNDEEEDYNDFSDNNEFSYMESIKNKLKVSNFEHKYRRLVSFLVKMHDNIKLANIYIDRRELNRLKDPINTIKKGNKTLIDTISSGRLKDEKLMEITLGTTEDISQTISREEEMKTGNKPKKFNSYFVINEIIPNKNNNKMRAKSEKKKITLNPRNKMEQNNFNNFNNNNNNNNNNNIKNVDDIFDLFSATKPVVGNEQSNYQGNAFNNNNNNNFMGNSNNNFMGNNNNNFMDNNNNNNFMGNSNNFNNNGKRMMNNKMNNNMNSNNNNNNFNQNNFNNNNNNNNNNMNFDLLQQSLNFNNQQNNNFQNNNSNMNNGQNKKYNNPNEFDMYGPAPEMDSNQLVQYIGTFDQNNNNNNNLNNNNNPYPNFNGGNQNNQNNNNLFSQNNNFGNNNNNRMNNNMGNNMNGNNGHQMSQEEFEQEQRLKELDDLF